MKKIFIPIFICLCLIAYVVGYSTTTTTTNLELVKITEGDLISDWFDTMNANMDLIDANNPQIKINATAAPTVNDDVDLDYAVGSRWIDVTNDKEYVALDVSTGAAVWTETTGAGGDTLPVIDTTGIAKGSVDATKIVRFEVDGLTTATTRVLTVLDKDLTLVGTVDKLSAFAATTSAELAGVISDETGTDKLVYNTSPTFVTPILGTPASGTLTSCTGLPIATGVSGLGANVNTFLATPSSANLAAAVTDETGTGVLVFGTSPTFTTNILTPIVRAVGAAGLYLHDDGGNGIFVEDGGQVSIGGQVPDTLFHVMGTTATDVGRFNMGIDINPVVQPTTGAMTIALVEIAGNVNAGQHYYRVSYYTALGETVLSSSNPTSVTTNGTYQQVSIANIPISTDYRVVGRKIYRTTAGSDYWNNLRLLTTIADNTTTTYTDNTADAGLTGTNYYWMDNTTTKWISVNGTSAMLLSDKNTVFGFYAGSTILAGTAQSSDNTLFGTYAGTGITTGDSNVAIGLNALRYDTTGKQNVGIGPGALFSNVGGHYNIGIGRASGNLNQSGSSNIFIGNYAGYSVLGSSNVLIGYNAGYSETGSNKLYIEPTNSATPLIYGEFNNDLVRIYGKLSGTVLTQTVVTMDNSDTTPTVAAGNVFISQSNTSATAITDLDFPTVGQIVTLIVGSATNPPTITDGGFFALAGNWTPGLNGVITLFVRADNDYVELSRSTN